jgi:hypothetical protein
MDSDPPKSIPFSCLIPTLVSYIPSLNSGFIPCYPLSLTVSGAGFHSIFGLLENRILNAAGMWPTERSA